jgi:hypothetical protein
VQAPLPHQPQLLLVPPPLDLCPLALRLPVLALPGRPLARAPLEQLLRATITRTRTQTNRRTAGTGATLALSLNFNQDQEMTPGRGFYTFIYL